MKREGEGAVREAEENQASVRNIRGTHRAPFYHPALDTPSSLVTALPVELRSAFTSILTEQPPSIRAATINRLEFAPEMKPIGDFKVSTNNPKVYTSNLLTTKHLQNVMCDCYQSLIK